MRLIPVWMGTLRVAATVGRGGPLRHPLSVKGWTGRGRVVDRLGQALRGERSRCQGLLVTDNRCVACRIPDMRRGPPFTGTGEPGLRHDHPDAIVAHISDEEDAVVDGDAPWLVERRLGRRAAVSGEARFSRTGDSRDRAIGDYTPHEMAVVLGPRHGAHAVAGRADGLTLRVRRVRTLR